MPLTLLLQHERGIHIGPYGGVGATEVCSRVRVLPHPSSEPTGSRHGDGATVITPTSVVAVMTWPDEALCGTLMAVLPTRASAVTL